MTRERGGGINDWYLKTRRQNIKWRTAGYMYIVGIEELWVDATAPAWSRKTFEGTAKQRKRQRDKARATTTKTRRNWYCSAETSTEKWSWGSSHEETATKKWERRNGDKDRAPKEWGETNSDKENAARKQRRKRTPNWKVRRYFQETAEKKAMNIDQWTYDKKSYWQNSELG